MKVSDLKEGFLYKDYSKRGHCKNGTFTVKISKSGNVYIRDTYWSGSTESYGATDEFVKNFEEVLELDKWRIIKDWSLAKLYDDEDVIQVHYNQCSGRISGNFDYFIRKGAKKSKDKVIEELEEKINWMRTRLEHNVKELEMVKNDEVKPSKAYIM